MKNIALVTDIAFWEIGNGQNARIRALHAFLNQYSKLTLYYLGENAPLELGQHDLIIVVKLHLDWVADLDLKGALVFLDAHDLISERAQSFQQFNRSCASLSFEEEMARFAKFNKVILLQKEDIEKAATILGKERLLLCSHPVMPEEECAVRDTAETIGFFAGPSWPNIDGIQWFHDLVLPSVDLKCVVHGGINYSPFLGFSPRLIKGQMFSSPADCYKNIDIAINPVLYGSGLKIKTVEALSYGIPLVTTSVGGQGLLEEAGRSFLLADTPAAFAAAINRLAASLDLRRELSMRAKVFAREHFTPGACFANLL